MSAFIAKAFMVSAPVFDNSRASVFEDAVEVLRDFSSGVFSDVLQEFIVGLSEGDIVVVADVPVEVGVVSSALVVCV